MPPVAGRVERGNEDAARATTGRRARYRLPAVVLADAAGHGNRGTV